MNTENNLEDFWNWLDKVQVKSPETPLKSTERSILPGYGLSGTTRRKKPTSKMRAKILDSQKNRCLYCGNLFGTFVTRKYKTVSLRLQWDHFIPYSYLQANPWSNWVAACHICNGIKNCLIFDTPGDASKYILARWKEKGYTL